MVLDDSNPCQGSHGAIHEAVPVASRVCGMKVAKAEPAPRHVGTEHSFSSTPHLAQLEEAPAHCISGGS
jgi:hypothetical protein